MNEAGVRELYERAIAARGTAGREQCVPPAAVLALVRREGAEDERLATLDHVMSCGACQRELELLRAIEETGAKTRGRAASSTAERQPRRADGGRWRRTVPFALAASLLLAVGVAVRDRFGGTTIQDLPRGEGNGLTLVAPAPGADLAPEAPATFVWRSGSGARGYVLEILDLSGRAIVTERTADTVLTLPTVTGLAAGAEYQWWVRMIAPGDDQRASPLRRLRIRSQ